MRVFLFILLMLPVSAWADSSEYPILLCVGELRGPEAHWKKLCERKKGDFQECMKEQARKQGDDYGLLRINGNHVVGPDVGVGLKRAKYTFRTRNQSVAIDFSKKKANKFCAFFTSHGGLAIDPCKCKHPVSETY